MIGTTQYREIRMAATLVGHRLPKHMPVAYRARHGSDSLDAMINQLRSPFRPILIECFHCHRWYMVTRKALAEEREDIARYWDVPCVPTAKRLQVYDSEHFLAAVVIAAHLEKKHDVSVYPDHG